MKFKSTNLTFNYYFNCGACAYMRNPIHVSGSNKAFFFQKGSKILYLCSGMHLRTKQTEFLEAKKVQFGLTFDACTIASVSNTDVCTTMWGNTVWLMATKIFIFIYFYAKFFDLQYFHLTCALSRRHIVYSKILHSKWSADIFSSETII